MLTVKEICEITYTFEFTDPEGKPGKICKTFTTEDGDWFVCHAAVDRFTKSLTEKGNKVHHLKHLNSSSYTVRDYDY